MRTSKITFHVELSQRLSEEERAEVSAALVAQVEGYGITGLSCTIDGETGGSGEIPAAARDAADMLAALKLLVAHRGMMGSPSWGAADAIIAKVEGSKS